MGTERTDDDTWDLATTVGATATMVAAGRARATNAALIDDPFAEPLVRAVGIEFFTRWASGELAVADVDLPGAPWGMQPMTDLLTARTRYFDEFLRDATSSGIRQVVILASGLDARGYRLAWPDDTVIFELDVPDVLSFKGETIGELGARPTATLRNVPIDLRDDWPTALQEHGFDADRPSAWIAEGLLPFLRADAQDRLLDSITALSADGSRLASEVTVAPTNPSDEERPFDAVTERWRANGFDVEFGDLGFPGERKDVATYLDQRGWWSFKTPLGALLADAGLPAMVEAEGQLSFGANYYCASVRRTG
jgi:methyltransferase (TIGR00027 family)